PVHRLDDHEQHPGDDDEVDEQGDEVAVGDGGAILTGFLKGGGGRALELDEHLREVDAAGHQSDDRHKDVVHDRLNQTAKCGADDDADGEVDHVALEGEFPEFLKHVLVASPVFSHVVPS